MVKENRRATLLSVAIHLYYKIPEILQAIDRSNPPETGWSEKLVVLIYPKKKDSGECVPLRACGVISK